MNGYLLHTDIVAEALRPQPDPKVEAWFAWAYSRPKFLSVITFGHLEHAARLVRDPRRRSQMVAWLHFALRAPDSNFLLPITPAIASRWAQLLPTAKPQDSETDLLIQATAAEHSLTLTTLKSVTGALDPR